MLFWCYTASAAADEAEDERVDRDHTVSGGDIQLPSGLALSYNF